MILANQRPILQPKWGDAAKRTVEFGNKEVTRKSRGSEPECLEYLYQDSQTQFFFLTGKLSHPANSQISTFESENSGIKILFSIRFQAVQFNIKLDTLWTLVGVPHIY